MLVQSNHWIWQRQRSIDYNKKINLLNQKRKNGRLDNENSCSTSSSISSIEDTK